MNYDASGKMSEEDLDNIVEICADGKAKLQEKDGLSDEEMNALKDTLEDLFMSIDWSTVAEDDEENDQPNV